MDVTFVDGTTGEVDMRPFLDGSGVEGTVFEPLREPADLMQKTRRFPSANS